MKCVGRQLLGGLLFSSHFSEKIENGREATPVADELHVLVVCRLLLAQRRRPDDAHVALHADQQLDESGLAVDARAKGKNKNYVLIVSS